MTAQAVRVVTVTYSPGEALTQFLTSLQHATTAPVEVVLADNGSVDGSVQAALTRTAAGPVRSVELWPTGGNVGYGSAANYGARGAAGNWLVVANPDVVWQPGSLDALLEAAERWPNAGSLGPAIFSDGTLYPSARAFPSLGRGIGHALFGVLWPGNRWSRAYRQSMPDPTVEGAVGWLSGACLLLRREAFEQIGGFDESYFMYCEDLDLGARLAAAGWQNVYVPQAKVVHLGGHSTRRVRRPMLRAHHRSMLRYLSGQYPGLRWAPLRAALAAGLLGRYLVLAGASWLSERRGSSSVGAGVTRSGQTYDPYPDLSRHG